MKKVYEAPVVSLERFVANEYIAACGDSGTVYNFKCNAGERDTSYNVYFADGTPYASSNDYEENSAKFTGYHPCGRTHEAESNSGFQDGYMYKQNWMGNNSGSKIDVVIWTDNGTDVHCTTNLNRNDWETAKS